MNDGTRVSVHSSPGEGTSRAESRRRSESRRSEDLAARAEEAAGLGSWELGVVTGEQIWSDNLYRLMGLEVESIEPSLEYFLDRVHPDDRERVEALLNLNQDGEPAALAYRVVWPTGEVRHLRATLSITDREGDQPTTVIGSVQDVTEQRRTEREVAVHLAVIESLQGWTTLKERGPALLSELARALGAVVGVIWIPRGDVLECHAMWSSRTHRGADFLAETKKTRLPRGSGLPGKAWNRCAPVTMADPEDFDFKRGRLAAESEIKGAVAFPALHDGASLLFVELLAREQIELTESLCLSLTAIGHQLGQFMARHSGELMPHLLTAREVEILELAAGGLSGPGIAARLVISPATVKTHFENIYGKLGVPDRASAVAEVLRLGLFE